MKNKVNRSIKKLILLLLLCTGFIFPLTSQTTGLQNDEGTTSQNADGTVQQPFIQFNLREPQTNNEISFSVQVLLGLTLISLAPSLLILCTCFLRISIVLDFIKRALSLQQVPPTQVLNGIALIMTIFIMWPIFTTIYDNAFKPLSDGSITIETAYKEAEKPIRLFMYNQMQKNTSSIELCMSMARLDKPETLADVPTHVLLAAFILHELTRAFQIGFLLYIPFIIIDMVVSSILMSMGMIMLPPIQISMPFKLMLFVLVNGWDLIIGQLFSSFVV
ncbi:MAG: flagellar type III secretion system pore protein FliP [Spirochaetaceae bacterium]|nr:flagellar type III secretion system pore protein FliP [Spirochaetaceae bacterium]